MSVGEAVSAFCILCSLVIDYLVTKYTSCDTFIKFFDVWWGVVIDHVAYDAAIFESTCIKRILPSLSHSYSKEICTYKPLREVNIYNWPNELRMRVVGLLLNFYFLGLNKLQLFWSLNFPNSRFSIFCFLILQIFGLSIFRFFDSLIFRFLNVSMYQVLEFQFPRFQYLNFSISKFLKFWIVYFLISRFSIRDFPISRILNFLINRFFDFSIFGFFEFSIFRFFDCLIFRSLFV